MKLGTQLHLTPCAELIPKVGPVDNRGHIGVKPRFGLWTSSYVEGCSAWVEWCRDENFCNPYALNWFLLEPNPKARVLVIDTLADLKRLLAEFKQPPAPGFEAITTWPDFERIAEHWDAMHLTEAGQWRTRLTLPSLYGWDSESTLWFHWCFTDCRRIPVPAPPERSEDAE